MRMPGPRRGPRDPGVWSLQGPALGVTDQSQTKMLESEYSRKKYLGASSILQLGLVTSGRQRLQWRMRIFGQGSKIFGSKSFGGFRTMSGAGIGRAGGVLCRGTAWDDNLIGWRQGARIDWTDARLGKRIIEARCEGISHSERLKGVGKEPSKHSTSCIHSGRGRSTVICWLQISSVAVMHPPRRTPCVSTLMAANKDNKIIKQE